MRARVNRPTFFDDDGREEKALPAAVASLSLDLLFFFFSRSLPPSSPPALPLLPPPARSALSINKKPFGFQLLKKTSKTSGKKLEKKTSKQQKPQGPDAADGPGLQGRGRGLHRPGPAQAHHLPARAARVPALLQGQRRRDVPEGGLRVQRPDLRPGRRLRRRPQDEGRAVPLLRRRAQVRPTGALRASVRLRGARILRGLGRRGSGGPEGRAG